jgi:serine/threonine protein kinase
LAPKPINNEETVAIASQDDLEDEGPPKRLRVTDINITRYEEEFVEIKEIASGTFGKVKVARHRLDGMIYAIKVSNKQ